MPIRVHFDADPHLRNSPPNFAAKAGFRGCTAKSLSMKRFLGLLVLVAVVGAALPSAAAKAPPKTGFEQRGGESWTTHEEELAFLKAVDAGSDRVRIATIGQTDEKRPLHLVKLGYPAPAQAAQARRQPTVLFICSQHGNEPAGREACLRWLRDLAFTKSPAFVNQLRHQTVLFIPTANPDGRARNSRENGTEDINRDHIDLSSPEARAIAHVVKVWKPDTTVDLHEFGPPVPGLYDDELLYLWPRNLNVDPQVHAAAKTLALEYVRKGAEARGERAGEYGRYRIAGDYHVTQSAGDEDDGIARNAFGLRHSAGLLLETRVEQLVASPGNPLSAALMNRRVNTHHNAVRDTLTFMREQGPSVSFINANAALRKAREGANRSAPVYFNGQDEDGTLDGSGEAQSTSFADPPPCGYRLTAEEVKVAGRAMKLHGISTERRSSGVFVPMGQDAEPVIPLLLDERASRNAVEAQPLDRC